MVELPFADGEFIRWIVGQQPAEQCLPRLKESHGAWILVDHGKGLNC